MAAAGVTLVRTYGPIWDTAVLDTLHSRGIGVAMTVFYDSAYGSSLEGALEAVCALKQCAAPRSPKPTPTTLPLEPRAPSTFPPTTLSTSTHHSSHPQLTSSPSHTPRAATQPCCCG